MGSMCLMLHMQARKAVAHEVEQLHASRARLVTQLQALTKAVSIAVDTPVDEIRSCVSDAG
jgi:hypothetical protein